MGKRKIKRQAEVAWQKYDQRLVAVKMSRFRMEEPPLEEYPHPPFPDPAGPRPEDWRFFDDWWDVGPEVAP